MKYFLIIYFSITFSSVFAQEPSRKIAVGISYSPDLAHRGLNGFSFVKGIRNNTETYKLGHTTGLTFDWFINENFALESGILYSNKGYRTVLLEYTTPPNPDEPEKGRLIYNYHYLDVPVHARVFLGKRNIKFTGSAGLTFNIFLDNHIKRISIYSDRTTSSILDDPYDYNRIVLSSHIGSGISFEINDKSSIRTEVVCRYGLTRIIESSLSGYLWSLGMNAGYYISF